MSSVLQAKEIIEVNPELENEINESLSDEEVEGLLRRESASDPIEKMTRRVSKGERRVSNQKTLNSEVDGPPRKSSITSSSRFNTLVARVLGEMPKRERAVFFREMLTQVSRNSNESECS